MEIVMITLLDTTYREGKQSYVGNKLPPIADYLKLINKMGVENIELSSSLVCNSISLIKKMNRTKKIRIHSSINYINFEKLINLGVRNIGVSFKPDVDIFKQISQLREIISHYKDKGLMIRVGIEDSFSMRDKNLLKICNHLKPISEIYAICLSDTEGSSVPETTKHVLNIFDKQLPKHISLEVHLHNDVGLAAANLYASIELFLTKKRELIIDYSFGGIGERNGIVSLGDVFALFHTKRFSSLKCRYNMKHYTKLYNLVFSKILFQRDPLNPSHFSQSSGLHIYKFLETGSYTGNLSPGVFGTKMSLIFNDQVSSEAIKELIKRRLRKTLSDSEIQKIKLIIRENSQKSAKNYTEKDVLDLVSRIMDDRDNK